MNIIIGNIGIFAIVFGLLAFGIIGILTAICLRRIVRTNEVHIVQSRGKTKSYGVGSGNGNVYYEWPTWIPIIGITKTVLPVSVFQLELNGYDAYDKDRLPFEIDVVAFFRVSNPDKAAERVSSIGELHEQLTFILKGAARTTLASYDINQIMIERSKFGDHFTLEVKEQLTQWGVETVKNIELMDIRDADDSKVVHNIMAKTKSLIEMESRSEVAANMQKAQTAEIQAQQKVDLEKENAAQLVGMKKADREQAVGIATQKSTQAVKEQERVTKEKEMAVMAVAQVKQAEITKSVSVVKAEQDKETAILIADGQLESKKRESEGIEVKGRAVASAETAFQLAPVQAQITLAKEIGENKGYQEYLVTIKQVEASQAVGMEQAKALEKANIKIIANAGEPVAGVAKVMDLFSSKGGTSIGAMLEGLANTEQGEKLLGAVKEKLIGKETTPVTTRRAPSTNV